MKASFKSLLSLILIFSISFPAFPAESLQAPAEKSESVPFKKRMIAKLKQGQKKLEKALRCITGKDSCSKQEWAEITIAAVALIILLKKLSPFSMPFAGKDKFAKLQSESQQIGLHADVVKNLIWLHNHAANQFKHDGEYSVQLNDYQKAALRLLLRHFPSNSPLINSAFANFIKGQQIDQSRRDEILQFFGQGEKNPDDLFAAMLQYALHNHATRSDLDLALESLDNKKDLTTDQHNRMKALLQTPATAFKQGSSASRLELTQEQIAALKEFQKIFDKQEGVISLQDFLDLLILNKPVDRERLDRVYQKTSSIKETLSEVLVKALHHIAIENNPSKLF